MFQVPAIFVKCHVHLSGSARYICQGPTIFVTILEIFVKCQLYLLSANYFCHVSALCFKCHLNLSSVMYICQEVPGIFVNYICKMPALFGM